MDMLKKGSSGYQVKVLQTLLKLNGYDCGTVDGQFGGKTYAAVIAFQKSRGLVADGIVGPKTWNKLLGVA
jgi:peptidoglycan hydrolase-like protein with peptidoglycan-binding domain